MSEPISQVKAAFNWKYLVTFLVASLIIQALTEYFPSFNAFYTTPIATVKGWLGIKS